MAALEFLKKSPGVLRMGAILLLGVLLLLFATGGKEEKKEEAEGALSEYGALLEQSLASLCAEVEGVGRVRVMVTFERGEEALYQGSVKIASVPPRVMGVAVLCSGGGDASVRAALTEMLGALLGVGANRISVLTLAQG